MSDDRTGGGRAVGTIAIVTTVAITHEVFLLPHASVLLEAGHRVVGISSKLASSAAAKAVYDATYNIPLGRKAPLPDLIRSGGALRRIVDMEQADVVWAPHPPGFSGHCAPRWPDVATRDCAWLTWRMGSTSGR